METKALSTVLLTDAVGKTIKRVHHENDLILIKYTDESFSYLQSCFAFDDTVIENRQVTIGDYPASDLAIDFGFYTQEEYDDWEVKVEIQRNQDILKVKRRLYDELKKLFEDK